ncbi:MAG: DUF1624 domain-containing protein [Brevundimonas sp.]|nr:MAG: DUF1624 domain-containing protein [Brevundimonas sp.]
MSATGVERLTALDVLRGLAVAGMILVVSPGDWGMAWTWLQHAEWDGWHLADMVFPTFLFSVGVSVALSFPRDVDGAFWTRVARRVLLLIALGLALEATNNLAIALGSGAAGQADLGHLRLPGVLQRIGLCYGLAVLAVVATGRWTAERVSLKPGAVGAVIAVILISYWLLLTFVGGGRTDPEGNLGAVIDRALFTPAHLWPLGSVTWGGPVVYDPEGLLSTLPATANVLFGVLAGHVWRTRTNRTTLILATAGLLLFLAGMALDPVFVVNKRIWTSSFALLSSGFSSMVLAALITQPRRRIVDGALSPFRILGGNAILAFIVSTLLGRLYGFPFLPVADATHRTPQGWLNARMLSVFGEPHWASFVCAVLMVTVVTLILAPLHRRAIHFRL